MKDFDFKLLGKILLIAGIAGLLASVIISFTIYAEYDNGGLPAISFLVIMLSLALCFPTMLEESKGEVSTMRIIVFSITMVFCVIYLKIAWASGTFQNLTIDKSWIYILGLAFGSKAAQKFAEDDTKNDKDVEEKKK